jgi:ABC-type dipeptide/oligopeptide/nickel transport system permease subunit
MMIWVNTVIIAAYVLVMLVGPQFAPLDPTEFQWGEGNLPPAWVQNGNVPGEKQHLLGTDTYGRDLFSRLIYATRTTLLLALVSVPLSGCLGLLIGVIAGYFGGQVDNLLMRFTDLFNAFPAILFAILIMLIFQRTPFGLLLNGLVVLILAFTLIGWVNLARLVRAAVLSVKEELYVEAARSVGLRAGRILLRYILPNILGLVVIWAMTAIARVIVLEALLGYIGIGIVPAIGETRFVVTSWGGLFFEGRQAIHSNPVRLVAPALCVIVAAVSFTLLGDELRDTLDPRLRRLG